MSADGIHAYSAPYLRKEFRMILVVIQFLVVNCLLDRLSLLQTSEVILVGLSRLRSFEDHLFVRA